MGLNDRKRGGSKRGKDSMQVLVCIAGAIGRTNTLIVEQCDELHQQQQREDPGFEIGGCTKCACKRRKTFQCHISLSSP